jgi:hypothetical protein
LTDAITGAFFGAHAGWHGLKSVDAAHVDPAIRDAAKVVQDRQEVMERAQGVPVDMKSAAVHRELMENALGDLMTDKSVDSSGIDIDGAAFARPEIDESAATQIIRDAFVKSGVLDDAAQFDRWLAGDFEIEPPTPVKAGKSVIPVESENTGIGGAHEDFPQMLNGARAEIEKGNFEAHATDKGDVRMTIIHDAHEEGNGRILAFDRDGNHVGDLGYTRGQSPDGTRWNPQLHVDEAWRRKGVANAMYDLAEKNGAKIPDLNQPGQIRTPEGQAFREARTKSQKEAEAPESVKPETDAEPAQVSPGALADRPDLQIVNEHGEALHAGDEQQRALDEEAQANKEAEPMHQAAVDCEARYA